MNICSTSGSSGRVFSRRSGLSLIELLAAMTIMSLFAAAVASHFDRSIFAATGAQGAAANLKLKLLTAQRSAIRTGRPHGIRFNGDEHDVRSYQMFEVLSDGSERNIDTPVTLGKDFTFAVSRERVMFSFEGNSVIEFSAKSVGPRTIWEVDVRPLTRMIVSRAHPL